MSQRLDRAQFPDCNPPAAGFVLIGVVMFVLALTILGLSLFALSSYEAQFAGRTYDSERALDVAQSGIEHAKFVLAKRQRLQDVGSELYPTGILYARARRTDGVDPDTVANLSDIPDDVPVEIRVLADVNGTRRLLQANYLPKQGLPIYKRLMTITNTLYLKDTNESGDPACNYFHFSGEVRHGGVGVLTCGNYSDQAVASDLPEPDVATFLGVHMPGATSIVPPARPPQTWSDDFRISLVGGGGPQEASYFKTVTDPLGAAYSFFVTRPSGPDNGRFIIHVDGWVVWMFPKGFRSLAKVVVEGSGTSWSGGVPHDCLVIVAGPSDDNASIEIGTPSLWFDNTIEVQNQVPVILVSSGWFGYEHSYKPFYGLGETLPYLSLFARNAYIGAGEAPMHLMHGLNDPYDAPDALIDKLCEQGALPNSQAGGIKFKPVAGTWIELPPPSN